jgi:hypothetical protein
VAVGDLVEECFLKEKEPGSIAEVVVVQVDFLNLLGKHQVLI